MRCPKCSGFVTPDLQTCPSCRASLGGEAPHAVAARSVADRYSESIDMDWKGWRSEVFGEKPALAGSASPPLPAPVPATGVREVAPELTVEAETLGFLNFLLLHAGFSPFTKLAVRGGTQLSGAQLKVRCAPEVVQATTVDLGGRGSDGSVEPPSLAPSYEAFFDLDEGARAQLELEIVKAGTVLTAKSLPVLAQNPNEWINADGIEAALAGVVTSNAPAVVDAVAALPGDFVAYQARDRNRVLEEVGRVYEGIRAMGLSYIGVPPSFEGTGQKVLFPDEVLSSRRGCCIDIATLTAAILERAGLNPLIVMVKGHAYTGAWTSDIRARQPVLRNADAIRQAVQEGDLLVWNSTTYFDREGDDGIKAAIEMGRRYLDRFEYALDVAACRQHGFKPAPRRTA